jgi:hypothetical protein
VATLGFSYSGGFVPVVLASQGMLCFYVETGEGEVDLDILRSLRPSIDIITSLSSIYMTIFHSIQISVDIVTSMSPAVLGVKYPQTSSIDIVTSTSTPYLLKLLFTNIDVVFRTSNDVIVWYVGPVKWKWQSGRIKIDLDEAEPEIEWS